MTAGPAYTYRAVVSAITDGDGLRLRVDVGFGIGVDIACRLARCNARELRDPGGREARDHLAALCPPGTGLTFRSLGKDKYSRWDGVLTLDDGRDVATQMIRDGYCAPWDGKGARPIPDWPVPAPL